MKHNEFKKLKHFFWEYDLKELDPIADEYLILKKVLMYGSVKDLKNFIGIFGKKKVKDFLLKTKGKGIDKRRLRFYEVIFDLPKREVDHWLKDPIRKIWER